MKRTALPMILVMGFHSLHSMQTEPITIRTVSVHEADIKVINTSSDTLKATFRTTQYKAYSGKKLGATAWLITCNRIWNKTQCRSESKGGDYAHAVCSFSWDHADCPSKECIELSPLTRALIQTVCKRADEEGALQLQVVNTNFKQVTPPFTHYIHNFYTQPHLKTLSTALSEKQAQFYDQHYFTTALHPNGTEYTISQNLKALPKNPPFLF
jgi:hypothetical protein